LFTLPDGGEVLIRESIPEDARGLREMFARCSHETIYLRFHLPLPTVPERTIELLAGAGDVHRDSRAVVAVDDGGGIAGHAMYARQRAHEAEMAIVVEDRRQSRGIGKLLLARLAEEAGGRGIEAFTSTVLGENRGALRFFSSVLSKAKFKIREGVYHLYVPLPGPEAGVTEYTRMTGTA
jgi:GNAT superfamily N-acetyltransferase